MKNGRTLEKKLDFKKISCFSIFILILSIQLNTAYAINFYSINIVTDELVILDSSTGLETVVGDLGYDVHSDIDLATIDGKLYGLDSHYGVGVNLLEINIASGSVEK